MFNLIRDKWGAILISLVIGLIFGLPHILIPILQDNATEYKPLVVKGVNAQTVDEALYASSIREVYDGHIIVRDSQLFEHKNDVGIFPTFPYLILGYMTHLTGSVENTNIISDFIFPILTFLLLYFFMFRLTRNRYISALCGCAILLRGFMFQVLKGYISHSSHIQHILRPLLYPSRLPFTQFTFIILLSAIILLYLFLKERKTIYGISCGIFTGLLFYTYLYHWTFFFSGIGILLLILILKRDYENSKRVLAVIAIGLLISIPYWIDFVKFKSLPYSDDILGRMGLELGRTPSISSTITYLIFLSIFAILVKKRDEIFYILTSLLLGGIVCINAQILLGYTVQSYHWPLTGITPLIVIMAFYMISQVLVTEYNLRVVGQTIAVVRRCYKPVFTLSILLFLAYGTYHHYMFSKNTYRYYTLPDTTIDAYNWLDRNTKTDDVVLSVSVENIDLIPVYTRDNNFIPSGYLTLASTEEILDRIYIAYKLLNVSPIYLEKLVNQDSEFIKACRKQFEKTGIPNTEIFEEASWNPTFFTMKYYIGPSYLPDDYHYPKEIKEKAAKQGMYYIPLEVRQEILSNYDNYTANTDSLLSKYRIDYIYYGPHERRIGNVNLSEYKQFDEVYRNEDVIIYKVVKNERK